MRTVDGILSKQAQRTDRSALVFREEDGTFTLERRDQPALSLGDSFGRAQSALHALRQRNNGWSGGGTDGTPR